MSEASQLSESRFERLRMGSVYGISDVGLVRRANEDNFLIDATLSLVMVADGMGGHQDGAMASADALRAVRDYIRYACNKPAGADLDSTVPLVDVCAGEQDKQATRPAMANAANTVFDAVTFANQRVFANNLARHCQEGHGMGTTMTGIWQLAEGAPLTVFHVGDSRLYRYRAHCMEALTRDQTMYQRALEAGATVNLPARNLLWQALGPYATIEPEIRSHASQPGDLLLLCSDGLHGSVPQGVIEGVLRSASARNLDRACSKLIALAKACGGRDNITAVLICCK